VSPSRRFDSLGRAEGLEQRQDGELYLAKPARRKFTQQYSTLSLLSAVHFKLMTEMQADAMTAANDVAFLPPLRR
jgi:hypothetical protein